MSRDQPISSAIGGFSLLPMHLVISPLKLLDMGEIDNEDESGSDHGLKLSAQQTFQPSAISRSSKKIELKFAFLWYCS